MNANTQSTRQTIRKLIRTKRRSLSAEQQTAAAEKITRELFNNQYIQQAKTIAVYLAADGELDLSFFIQECWQQGKQVYLPVIHPFSQGNLLFLHYQQDSQLVSNQYGILEPKLNVNNVLPSARLDIIITPLVAFDNNGNRMGMGGGFYDRTLASRNIANNQNVKATPYPIGVAHQCQQLDEIPIESWDVPLQEIIAV